MSRLLEDRLTLTDDDVRRIARAVVEQLRDQREAEPAEGPITTWRAVAEALGVSEQTVHRRRRSVGDTTKKPHFDGVAAARKWWGRVIGRAPVPTSAPASSKKARSAHETTGTTLADLKAKKAKGKLNAVE